jgi:hypothetical protein
MLDRLGLAFAMRDRRLMGLWPALKASLKTVNDKTFSKFLDGTAAHEKSAGLSPDLFWFLRGNGE